jgi:zinc protease
MDSKFYGMPFYLDEIQKHLKTLTLEQVNAAIKKYLDPDNLDVVIVTKDAGALAERLRRDTPSPKTYANPVAEQVLTEDKAIQALPVKPTTVETVPVDQVFQK